MNKYQNSKIYKIVCRITNLIYIGSTTQKYLSDRLKGHVYRFKNKIALTSSKVLENNDYYIELIELFPCNSKDELLVKERYYFDLIDCVNKYKPISTLKEKKEYKKEQLKEYYQNNKDKIKKQKKQYSKENKEKIKEQRKESSKKYYLKMKELKQTSSNTANTNYIKTD